MHRLVCACSAIWLGICSTAMAAERCEVSHQPLPCANKGGESSSVAANGASGDDYTEKVLMITDPRVVGGLMEEPKKAAWSFPYLIRQLAENDEQKARKIIVNWLNTFRNDTEVNGITVKKREAITETIIVPWMQADGFPDSSQENKWAEALTLENAPVRLAAIVNRLDLAGNGLDTPHQAEANQGLRAEGRFVFQFVSKAKPQTQALPFTLIFEYGLPLGPDENLWTWASRWHKLSTYSIGTEEYNIELEKVTKLFTDPRNELNKPAHSSLNQIRTNEIALGHPWQMREFNLGVTGLLDLVTVKKTPDLKFNDTPTLAGFISAAYPSDDSITLECSRVCSISDGEGQVKIASRVDLRPNALLNEFPGTITTSPGQIQPFLGGFADVSGGPFSGGFLDEAWKIPGPDANSRKLKKFSFDTCNGCHAADTGTIFTHIDLRREDRDKESSHNLLSGFLTQLDLKERKRLLIQTVNSAPLSIYVAFSSDNITSNLSSTGIPSPLIKPQILDQQPNLDSSERQSITDTVATSILTEAEELKNRYALRAGRTH